jgi:hypothetical protein
MVERLIILSDKTITDGDVKAFANPSAPGSCYSRLLPHHKQILTSLPISRNIRITPNASTSNLNWKKTTGTYQKLLMILIYNEVTFTVK